MMQYDILLIVVSFASSYSWYIIHSFGTFELCFNSMQFAFLQLSLSASDLIDRDITSKVYMLPDHLLINFF